METRTRKFSPFFSITVAHAFFGGGTCPYISLEPEADCRLLLAQKRLICKKVAGGVQLITETEWSGAAPGPAPKTSPALKASPVLKASSAPDEMENYRFAVRVEDTAFFSVTKLDLSGYPGQLFCFSNSSKGNRLSVKKYTNPGRNREAILGIVEISLTGGPPGKAAQEAFLLVFETIPGYSGVNL